MSDFAGAAAKQESPAAWGCRAIMENTRLLNLNVAPGEPERKKNPAAEWLTRQIIRGHIERFTEVVDITPELARLMLARNAGNRPLAEVRVYEHMKRIEAGTFLLTHQGIAFADNGQLNDGQHRLTAIMRSEQTVRMQVTFGCDREEFAAIDTGKARTAADLLSIRGVRNYALQAAIGLIMCRVATGNVTPKAQEVAAFTLTLDPVALEEACSRAGAMKRICSTSFIGAAHYWIATRTRHAAKLEEFWRGLVTGENISGPRLELRHWLMKNEFTAGNTRDTSAKRAAAVVLAWNAHIAGRKHVKLTWDHVVKLPDVA